jgi:hypothetical protein
MNKYLNTLGDVVFNEQKSEHEELELACLLPHDLLEKRHSQTYQKNSIENFEFPKSSHYFQTEHRDGIVSK